MHDTLDAVSMKNEEHTFRDKLGFAVWGVRYFDIIILMAYPTMGAVFAIGELDLSTVVRLLVFTVFNFLFVTHVYIFNDWSDARLNPEEPKRRTRHALKHPALTMRQVFTLSMVLGVIALVGFAFLSWRLLAVAVFIELVTASYSHPRVNLKGRPVISTVIHFIGASLYFMGGWAVFMPFSIKEACLGSFFGLVLAAGHFSNEIEDFELDMAAGIRTNAIAFGQRVVFRVGLFLFILSSIFFIYVAWQYLEVPWYFNMPLHLILGIAVLLSWIIQTWRYRNWKGGDPIQDFRRFYRYVYALLCAALILILLIKWTSMPVPLWAS
jgi:4-hydroxybenzoate polyprenyltransferase